MINEKSLTAEWYLELTGQYKNLDRNLFDKVTHALYLLEKLSESSMPFIFKGGTSLLLLLQELRRLSIDIDIIVPKSVKIAEINEILKNIVRTSSFTRYEEQERHLSQIPKAHFKLFYESPFNQSEVYVLLDVLFEENPYSRLDSTDIVCPFIDTIPPNVTVKVPSIADILGDKLTAFAPNTTGILYDKEKEMEIIKQLFDIESLFDQLSTTNGVKDTFIRCAEQELNYRQLTEMNYENVLDDIFKTAIIIGGRGSFDKETFLKLENGIRRIKSHIINRNYIVEEAVVSASKAAYLSMLLKHQQDEIEKYHPKETLPELEGVPLFKKMAKIKNFSPEAYYYFAKAQELIRRSEKTK